jgi:hypothetical protein
MIENMRSRDCELPGVLACPTLADQEKRFIDAGFSQAKVSGDFSRIIFMSCIFCLFKDRSVLHRMSKMLKSIDL